MCEEFSEVSRGEYMSKALSVCSIFSCMSRHQGLVVSKSGPYRSVLRMVPPLCLSMDDVDPVADGLEHCFAKLS